MLKVGGPRSALLERVSALVPVDEQANHVVWVGPRPPIDGRVCVWVRESVGDFWAERDEARTQLVQLGVLAVVIVGVGDGLLGSRVLIYDVGGVKTAHNDAEAIAYVVNLVGRYQP